jgi:hypothetical protein
MKGQAKEVAGKVADKGEMEEEGFEEREEAMASAEGEQVKEERAAKADGGEEMGMPDFDKSSTLDVDETTE